MKKKWTKTWLVGLVVLLTIAFGALGVLAQDDDTPPDDEPAPLSPWEDHQARLAEALGITVEELEAAQQKAEIARITQAVEDGVISNDQGNLMLAMIYLKDTLDQKVLLATALGVSVEEVEQAMDDGTLHDLMGDMTPMEMHEAMQTAFDDALQGAVDDMTITEEQADLVREHLDDGNRLFHFGWSGFGPHGRFGPPNGMMMGRGGFHGYHH